ncbi:MAG: DUF3987 domain-containing protein [Paludibacteraceae bacterium]|nr:DUF3987 domain-containing protein [Paludibacteraceae bacterium]
MIENLNQEEQANLRIVENMDVTNLPPFLQSVLSLASSPAEKDMLLLASLTACGAVMPNLYCRYGIAAKRYYPNLQLFIVGSAACGKGIANLALELVKPIHEKTPLIIPGDATYPAFYQTLARQHGRGYIHESEGSVITDIWRSSTANYNTALRKAAEHEPISRARCREASVIENPQLSMVLTGTFSQYRALVPSVENGYFSRLLTLIVNEVQPFSEQYVRPAENAQELIKTCSEQLYCLYQSLFAAKPREFRLTKEQSDRLGLHLKTAYPMLIRLLGEDFHSVILRMAIQIERIAMILTALRTYSLPFMGEELRSIGRPVDGRRTLSGVGFYCSDLDYQTAELIGNKLLLHMAQAYQLIKGTEKVEQPQVKPLDQKQILLSLLPDEFGHSVLVREAASQGIPARTAERWNEVWQQQGIVFRVKHDCYKKIA